MTEVAGQAIIVAIRKHCKLQENRCNVLLLNVQAVQPCLYVTLNGSVRLTQNSSKQLCRRLNTSGLYALK